MSPNRDQISLKLANNVVLGCQTFPKVLKSHSFVTQQETKAAGLTVSRLHAKLMTTSEKTHDGIKDWKVTVSFFL